MRMYCELGGRGHRVARFGLGLALLLGGVAQASPSAPAAPPAPGYEVLAAGADLAARLSRADGPVTLYLSGAHTLSKPLKITQKVTVVADPKARASLRIEAPVEVLGGHFELRHLDVVWAGQGSAALTAAVGQLTLDHVDVDGKQGTGHGVRAYMAGSLTLSNCTVHDTKDAGVALADTTKLALRDTTINRTGGAGVLCGGGCDAVVDGATITAAKGAGILVTDTAYLRAVDTTVEGSTLAGIQFASMAGGTVAKSQIQGGWASGVLIDTKGTVTVTQNRIVGSGLAGVEVREPANPAVSFNTIKNSKGAGVYVHDTQGVFTGNTIWGSVGPGVLLRKAQGTVLAGNQISYGKAVGVRASEGSYAQVADDRIKANAKGGVEVLDESVVHVVNARIGSGAAFGVRYAGKSRGAVMRGQIVGHTHGVEITEGSAVEVHAVTIHDNHNGVVARGQGKVRLVGNRIAESKGEPVKVDGGQVVQAEPLN